MADFSAWEAYKPITVLDPEVDGNLTDFPCLVVLDGDADVGGRSQSAGQDLRFTLSDGTTQLPHEIENFAIDGTPEASGNIWVKVPSIAASGGASIRMYYGNDGASDGQDIVNVWDANYVGVYHLSETTGTHFDSTSKSNDGTWVTDGGTGTQDAAGKVDGAVFVDGSGDHVNITDNTDMEFGTGNFTISAWLNAPAGTALRGLVTKWVSGDGWYLQVDPSEKMRFGTGNNDRVIGTVTVADNTWHQVTGVRYGTGTNEVELFTDGASEGTGTSNDNITGGTSDVQIGDFDNLARPNTGTIDEVRISDSGRSAEWVKFEHANIDSAGNELTIGAEVVQAVDIPHYYYAQEQAAALCG